MSTTLQVEKWLKSIQMQQYTKIFIKNGFTSFEMVMNIKKDEILKTMGISLLAHRLHILQRIDELTISIDTETNSHTHNGHTFTTNIQQQNNNTSKPIDNVPNIVDILRRCVSLFNKRNYIGVVDIIISYQNQVIVHMQNIDFKLENTIITNLKQALSD
eukprot:87163_1